MTSRKRTASDFIFKEELGHGSYSTVYKAIDRRSPKRVYAIKVCSKAHIIRESKVKYVTIEKNTLNLLARGNHPGIVKLYYTFHDAENLYFALDFAPGGELLSLLHKSGTFNESLSKHFTVQLIDALQFIHSQGVIHRDLKPENVLLDKDGRLMITDFGAACTIDTIGNNKNDPNDMGSTSSFVGTAEYVSPELLLYNKCTASSDIWALGCIIYQFVSGSPPFRGENELKTFEKIVELDYSWNPRNFEKMKALEKNINPKIINLVRKILVLDAQQRVTLDSLKLEPWFENISWNNKTAIWQGIFSMNPNLLQNNGYSQFSSNHSNQDILTEGGQQRMIPNRQLHVIDTPLKNITITKQKKKKPMKISTNTNSIVEWRKRLGISSIQNNMEKPSTSGNNLVNYNPTSDNITLAPYKIVNNYTGNSLPSNLPTEPNPRVIVNSSSSPYMHPSTFPNPTKPMVRAYSRSAPIPMQIYQPPKETTSINPPLNVPYNSRISTSTVPVLNQNNSSQIINPEQNYENSVITNNNTLPSTTDNHTDHILKQDYVYVHEIPYQLSGPEMDLRSYNKIDNDLITNVVSKYKNVLRQGTKPKLLTLNDKGYLFYSDDVGLNEHNIVHIGDSDLSMYDFEFDEERRVGFLILEKYKEKIWFISLPETIVASQLSATSYKTSTIVINSDENWVNCFFRSRKLLEDNKLTDQFENLNLNDHQINKNIMNHSSTSFDTKAPIRSTTPQKKPTSIFMGHKTNSNSGTVNGSKKTSKNSSNTTSYSSQATIASKNALLNHLHKEIQIPTMKGGIPIVPRRNLSSSTNPTISNDNKESKENFGPSSATRLPPYSSPTPPSPSKKYTAPKNIVVSSSRYEVINTLNSANNRVGGDQKIASSGASAAFKNLQKRKSESGK